ncbi:MAG: Serine/threonine-protein kinase PknD [Chlamydiia bacterium]|nr:Serine/threonine-protein kinase PknD [Chlamydiia bacterium]
MGSVYLVFDPKTNRKVALKMIRANLVQYTQMHRRFKREANVAAQLAHPNILSVFTIEERPEEVFYTMPYVQGETLKDILKATRHLERNEGKEHPVGSSIFELMRIFLNICQAVAYAHSRSILHRDIKPENIFIGNFGEVLLFDWGLSCKVEGVETDEEIGEDDILPGDINLTLPKKVIGTLGYMAPERTERKKATIQNEIYALGVILYQMLTLKMPFHRKSLKEFKRMKAYETYIEPTEAAPNREIPLQLSQIVGKCLAFDPTDRYGTIDALIKDIQSHIEGQPDWILSQDLKPARPSDWEFQEHILLNTLIAKRPTEDLMRWAYLMVSKQAFSGNCKLEGIFSIDSESHGIGFIFNIPSPTERESIEEGLCCWIGSKRTKGIRLYRSNVEIKQRCDFYLEPNKTYFIQIERVDQSISIRINGSEVIRYQSYLPFVGSHLGIISLECDYTFKSLNIYTGSRSAMINCLCVPDAFLALRQFDQAKNEYERIAQSFAGRQEGTLATFRKGIALIEEAKTGKDKSTRLDEALLTFSSLGSKRGVPLEYLGKSLVFQARDELSEEVKCLELALRRFPKHPMRAMIEEHVYFRLHESAKEDRIAAYAYALLVIQHINSFFENSDSQELIFQLAHHHHVYPTSSPLLKTENPKAFFIQLAVPIAFFLNKPFQILEIFTQFLPIFAEQPEIVSTFIYYLLILNQPELITQLMDLFASKEELGKLYSDELHTLVIAISEYIDTAKISTLQKIQSLPLPESDYPLLIAMLALYEYAFARGHISHLPERLIERIESSGVPVDLKLQLMSHLQSQQRMESIAKGIELDQMRNPSGQIVNYLTYHPGLEKSARDEWENIFSYSFQINQQLFPQFQLQKLEVGSPSWNSLLEWEKIQLYKFCALHDGERESEWFEAYKNAFLRYRQNLM